MIETVLARFASFGAVAVFLIATALPAAAQFEQFEEQDCLTNRALQSAVASGEIPPVDAVVDFGPGDELLSVELCESPNKALAYRVRVLDQYGEAETLVVPIGGDRQ